MRRTLICALLGLGLTGAASQAVSATCAAGAYHAGCAGPNGAVVTHKPAPPPAHVNCAAGAYHAGCAGPNGAVVTSKPAAPPAHVTCAAGAYHAGCAGSNAAVVTHPAPYAPRCYWNHGVKVCH
jgi:hypothetical protein